MKYLINRSNSMGDLMREFDSLARNVWNGQSNLGVFPTVNVWEEKDGYILQSELAGFTEKDVDVTIKENLLTISGSVEKSVEEKDRHYLIRESSGSNFSRSFHLPEDTDTSKVDATFKNGLLTLKLAKKEESQPRKIQIQGK